MRKLRIYMSNETTQEQDVLLARLIGKRIIAARRVICGRPYSQDIVLVLDDGFHVSFCGTWDEDTVIVEGDHGSEELESV